MGPQIYYILKVNILINVSCMLKNSDQIRGEPWTQQKKIKKKMVNVNFGDMLYN
jgi:hypothetical protein